MGLPPIDFLIAGHRKTHRELDEGLTQTADGILDTAIGAGVA